MSVAVSVPSSDGINTPDLWANAGPTTLRYFLRNLPNLVIATTRGDGINPIDLFGILSAAPVNNATIRYNEAGRRHNEAAGDQTQWRGWTFVIDPATLQPQISRNTTFPAAQ